MAKRLIVIILLSLVITACGSDEVLHTSEQPITNEKLHQSYPLNFSAEIFFTGLPTQRFPGYPALITLMDELIAYKAYYDGHLLGYDGGPIYMNDLLFGGYTDMFFEENFLIVFDLGSGSSSDGFRVDAVMSDGQVYILTSRSEIGTADVVNRHAVIEVEGRAIPKGSSPQSVKKAFGEHCQRRRSA